MRRQLAKAVAIDVILAIARDVTGAEATNIAIGVSITIGIEQRRSFFFQTRKHQACPIYMR